MLLADEARELTPDEHRELGRRLREIVVRDHDLERLAERLVADMSAHLRERRVAG